MLRTGGVPNLLLRIVVAAGLIIDAVVHLDIASTQPPGGAGQIDQSTLFRIEGIVSIVAAAAVLLLESMVTSLLAVLVAGTAFGGVVLSVYVDLGSIGPIPDLYEPVWYASKAGSAIAEGVALAAAIILFVVQFVQRRRVNSTRPYSTTATGSSEADGAAPTR